MADNRQWVRVRSWAVDTTSEVVPRLKYVYQYAYTTSKRDDQHITVIWQKGGLSVIANDHTVTWLEAPPPPAHDANASSESGVQEDA